MGVTLEFFDKDGNCLQCNGLVNHEEEACGFHISNCTWSTLIKSFPRNEPQWHRRMYKDAFVKIWGAVAQKMYMILMIHFKVLDHVWIRKEYDKLPSVYFALMH